MIKIEEEIFVLLYEYFCKNKRSSIDEETIRQYLDNKLDRMVKHREYSEHITKKK